MTLEEKLGQMIIYPTKGNVTGPTGSIDNIEELIKEGKCGNLFGALNASEAHRLQKLAMENTRMKIPLLLGCDVIHGYKTIFPVNLGISASWDLEEIERFARVSAEEASSGGLHWTFSPMCDISRDPRWGRVSEGSGEDPYLGGLIAAAWYADIKETICQKTTLFSLAQSISLPMVPRRQDVIITRWTSQNGNCGILISHLSKPPLTPEPLP